MFYLNKEVSKLCQRVIVVFKFSFLLYLQLQNNAIFYGKYMYRNIEILMWPH